MKLPNTTRGCPAGEPNEHWTNEQLVAYLRNQLAVLTAPDGKILKAVAATNQDILDIADEIVMLEKELAKERSRLTKHQGGTNAARRLRCRTGIILAKITLPTI